MCLPQKTVLEKDEKILETKRRKCITFSTSSFCVWAETTAEATTFVIWS